MKDVHSKSLHFQESRPSPIGVVLEMDFQQILSKSCWRLSLSFSSCPFWDSQVEDLNTRLSLPNDRIWSFHPKLFCIPVIDFACHVKNEGKT